MGFNLHDWYSEKNEGEVLLAYKGDITSDLITNILEVVESKLDDTPEKSKIRKKVYNVLVECLQNLYHHSMADLSGNDTKALKFGVFVVNKKGDMYSIISGNYVKNERVQYLKDRMDQLNSMTKDELKSLYKLILNNQEFSNKGGGGLGMIDIARKTESKLDYEFFDVDSDFSFYSLIIDIT